MMMMMMMPLPPATPSTPAPTPTPAPSVLFQLLPVPQLLLLHYVTRPNESNADEHYTYTISIIVYYQY